MANGPRTFSEMKRKHQRPEPPIDFDKSERINTVLDELRAPQDNLEMADDLWHLRELRENGSLQPRASKTSR